MGRSIHCTAAERITILILRKEGKSLREIARIVGRSKKLVENALKVQPVDENRGARRKTTCYTDRQIVRVSKNDPFKSSTEIKTELGLKISSRTIRRRLQDNNLHGRAARKVPLLSSKNIKQRLKFAKDHLDWNGELGIKKWRNILWSDETKINLMGSDGRRYVRRPPNQELIPKYTIKTVKHGGGNIKLWGAFSWYGVGPIYWIKEIMDQNEYAHILQEIMLPFAEDHMPLIWKYQQDNDPKHTSRRAKQFFGDNRVNVLPWPSQSPDLNPIENLWTYLKNAVGKHKTKNKQELWEIIKAEWKAIPLELCQKLVDSMPTRCGEVIKHKGHKTKY